MKNKFNIFKMTLLSLVVVCLSFGFAKALSNDNLKIISEKSINLSDITNININLDVDDITFINSSDDKLKIIEKCSENINFNNKLHITQNTNELNISRNNKLDLNNLDSSFKREVLIYLPQSYNHNLSLNITLGDVNFNSVLNLNKVDFILNNGDVNVKNNIDCNSLIIQSQTGEININALNANNFDLSLNTGNIKVSNLIGKGYLTVTNGNIDCGLYNLDELLELNSSAGDINVNIKNDIDFTLDASCDIGEINSDFKNSSNSTSNLLKANCGLGNIKINKKF